MGPFLILPGIAAVNTVLYVASADRSRRPWAVTAGCLAIALPFALEVVGVLPPSLKFEGGAMVHAPARSRRSPRVSPRSSSSLCTNLAVVVTAARFVARARDALHATQEQLYFHTWQLRQFVPGEAYGVVATQSIPPRQSDKR